MSDKQPQMDLFQGLIVSLAAGVMQHLGKTLNPVTNNVEKNLPAAQATIDMLDMLAEKTKGNLSASEEKLLKAFWRIEAELCRDTERKGRFGRRARGPKADASTESAD